MTKLRLALLLLALAGSACEKSSAPSAHGSGALSPAEGDLLAHLPAGGNVVFGGSLFNMQQRLGESAIGRIAAQMNPPEMTAWNACLAGKDLTMAGTVTIASGEVAMRLFLRGITVPEMETCARTAGLPLTADPDGKFITVETTQQGVTSKMPYLAVADGIYGVVSIGGFAEMALGGKPTVNEVTRADLERDVAGLAQGSAATDARVLALLPKVDRSKMIWFAGDAEGTPAADKVVMGYGSFSIDRGLAIDVTVKPRHQNDADEILSQFGKMKSQLNSLPVGMAALKDAIRSIKLGRVADGVRIQMALSDAQIDAIMEAVGPMMPNLR